MREVSAAAPLSLLLLVLVVQALNWPLGEALFGRDDCRDLTISSCECAPSLSEYELNCPGNSYNPKFKITIRPGSTVQIECNLTDASEYTQMPKLSIGSINMVQIKRCPLPHHTPIAGIMDHLGIRDTKVLIFEGNDLHVNLTRMHFERLQKLQRLRFAARRLPYIPEDLLSDMHLLNWLDMRAANLGALPARLLANMENLQFLELGSNNLKQLPRGLFHNLHKLLHLNLWSNQLHNLSKHDFEGATSVKDIDLHNNGIVQLKPDVFALLTNVTEINLNGNSFRSLPEGLFEHNKMLQQVKLQNNRVPLANLPARLFANLPELRTLYLRCELETLAADLIENSTALTDISLYDNRLSTLPAKFLEQQLNLINLDLHKNLLSHLPDGIFHHLVKLETLNLAENQLTEISSKLFSKLMNLKTLRMNDNRLLTIRPQAFAGNTLLRQLNLANNRINLHEYLTVHGVDMDLGSPFAHLRNLTTLNLRNNSLMVIFSDWKYAMRELQEIDLSYNNFTWLDYSDLDFVSAFDLTVNMSHNQLHTVHFYKQTEFQPLDKGLRLVHGVKSVHVDLNDNPLVCDCTLLRFLQVVRGDIQPDYAKNLITYTDRLNCQAPIALADRAMRFVHPSELVCNFDQAEDPKERRCPSHCECLVRTFDSTLIVNCSNGELTKIPKLPRLPQNLLEMELYVENNTLLKLPQNNAPGYENVTRLYVAGNNLTQLEPSQLPANLKYLDMSRNQLQLLNSSVLGYLNSTLDNVTLRLSQNPWICNCGARELLLFTQNKYERIPDHTNMFCMDAEMPTRLMELNINDICPRPKSLLIAVTVIISLAGFLLGISAALYYKYQQEIKIWLYAHNLCMWFVTEAELDKDKKFDAFISYSQKDQSFVEKHLVPQLEHGPQKFTLCVHVRNWLVGGFIPENIVRSVADSRRTIIVLSPNFIKSDWARMEFRAAHRSALNEGRSRVIVIIYSDIGDIEQLDDELKAYLRMNTYLKWGDPWFWDKLRYALPHRSPIGVSQGNGSLIKSALKGSTDDKLELIKPSPVTPPLTTPPGDTTKNPLVAQLNGGTPHTAIMIANGKNGLTNLYAPNGKAHHHHHHGNGHINGAFIINTNAKQSDV
ncbi:protein toll [Drosophila grimshawi]|uniref:GH14238 n=1 Tax=Drosophila grimshawi TaxID=7222 RepID=B4JY71_DROGR|nr:protein toll [Drosophila grimshawi]EDV90633.1 GH14238 [Drosophila grimshawi]